MYDEVKICECGREFTEAQSSGAHCFRCKLDGIRFNWVGGGGYGRKAFHDKTNTEVMRETESRAQANGVNAVKRSTRAELI